MSTMLVAPLSTVRAVSDLKGRPVTDERSPAYQALTDWNLPTSGAHRWGIIHRFDEQIWDDLLDEACHARVADHVPLSTTRLYRGLLAVARNAPAFAIWYADFFDDLPLLTSEAALLDEVGQGIRQCPAEIALRWQSADGAVAWPD